MIRRFKQVFAAIMVIALVLIGPGVAVAAQSTTSTVTLDAAIQQAIKNSSALQEAKLSTEKAGIEKDNAAKVVDYMPSAGLVTSTDQAKVSSYQQADISWTLAKKSETLALASLKDQVIGAYSSVLQAYNNLELTKLSLKNAKRQYNACKVAKEVGMYSDYDFQKFESSINEQETQVKTLQATYDSSVSTLRTLIGQKQEWVPVLASKPSLNTYKRDSLAVEVGRGVEESSAVWSAKAQFDVKQVLKMWFTPETPSDIKNINYDLASLDYNQAKDSAKSTIEQRYYAIDILEGKIATASQSYATAKRDLEIGELKYKLGLIPEISISGTADNLTTLRYNAENARVTLENYKASLATSKADFALLTGKNVYDTTDWVDTTKAGVTK